MGKLEEITQEIENVKIKIQELNNLKKQAEEKLSKLEKSREEIIKEQKRQETKNEDNEELEAYKRKLEEQKENISKVFPSVDNFVMQVETYFNKNLEKSLDKDLDVKERIKARMNVILTQYMILGMGKSKTRKELEKFDNINEYRMLSFEYGELIGLTDNEIINKGYLDSEIPNIFYDIFYNMLEGRKIEDILNNYYIEHNNSSNHAAKRDENGIIQYPHIGYAYNSLSYIEKYENENLRNKLSKENYDFSWKYNFMNQLQQSSEKLHFIIDDYNKKMGYSDDNEKMYRSYSEKYASPLHNKMKFKLTKELENYDSIIEAINNQKGGVK